MTIEVLQATAWYPPHSLGGTEVYLESLVDELAGRGVDCQVVVPRLGSAEAMYFHRGAPVSTYVVGPLAGPAEMREGRPHSGFETFQNILRSFRGGIYHQHSWSRGCGLQHLLAARERGLKTVVTVHVPGMTCMRGTMMRFGHTVCSGTIETRTCAACFLTGRGLSERMATAVAATPGPVARLASRLPGPLMTALATPHLAALRREEVMAMVGAADRVVAVCDWLADALRANGVPKGKLVLSRQGLSADVHAQLVSMPSRAAGSDRSRLKLLFLGRMDPTKGLDVLLAAMLALPRELPVSLAIHALPPAEESVGFADRLIQMSSGDERITFAGPVSRDEVPATLRAHDVLCIPSQWMETGPLVALEAAGAGLHVLASNMGGLRELVVPGEGGTLVPPRDVQAWASAIRQLASDHLGGVLKSNPRRVKTMGEVAEEMVALYCSDV